MWNPLGRFFQDNPATPFGSARRDLYERTDGYTTDDDINETDLGNGEARDESVGNDYIVTQFAKENGIDPNDRWAMAKAISKDANVKAMMGWPRSDMNPVDKAKLDAFTKKTLDPYIGRNLTPDNLIRGLDPYRDTRSASELIRGLGDGILFEGHGEAVLAAIKLADNGGTATIGVYEMNHPTIVAELAASRGSITMTTDASRFDSDPLTRAVGATLGYLSDNSGLSYNQVTGYKGQYVPGMGAERHPEYIHDHFKVIGANLPEIGASGNILTAQTDEIRSRQMLVLGSANWTTGAMGHIIPRGGKPTARSGFNMESSFALHHGMVKRGIVTQVFFDEMMRQGASAARWVHSRQGGIQDFAGDNSPIRSRLVDNAGAMKAHTDLLGELRASGGRASIAINTLGRTTNRNTFLTSIQEALVNPDVRIQLVVGSKWDGTSLSGGDPMQIINKTFTAAQRRQLDVVQLPQNQVHSKHAVYDINGRERVGIIGSTNFSNSSTRGYYKDKDGNPSGIPVRNLSVVFEGEDLAGLENSSFMSQFDVFGNIAESSRLMTSRPLGTEAFKLIDEKAQEFEKNVGVYGLTRLRARLVDSVDQQGAYDRVQFSVGGRVQVRDIHGKSFNFDMGEMKKFSAVSRPDNFEGQYYVPEFTKFVGNIKGVGILSKSEKKQGLTAAEGRGASALEVLTAGTAAAQNHLTAQIQELVDTYGGEEAQRMMLDPVVRGKLRQQVNKYTHSLFENFGGVEAGTPAYDSKADTRLAYRLGADGRLDMGTGAPFNAEQIDAIFSDGSSEKIFGKGDFFFAAGGLSRFKTAGGKTAARLYDWELVKTLPFGTRREVGGVNQYMFLMPMSKISQMPQRLQNTMSARNLSMQTDRSVLTALGVGHEQTEDLVAESLFVGGDGKAMKGFKLRGFMMPGMAGDNAYMFGQQFENAYVGDETWTRTGKVHLASAVQGDAGRIFVESVKSMAALGQATALTNEKGELDGRYLFTAEQLDAIEHRINMSTSRIPGTELLILQDLNLKTDRTNGMALILNLNVGDGIGMHKDGSTLTFTITGTTLRKLTSGDRSFIGLKAPYAFVDETSRVVKGVRAMAEGLDEEMYRDLGFRVGARHLSNSMFGSGVIKTGQLLMETGAEALKTGAWRKQLAYVRAQAEKGGNGRTKTLNDYATAIEKFAGLVEDATARQLFESIASDLKNGSANVFDKLQTAMEKTAGHLQRGGKIGLGPKTLFGPNLMEHAAASAMAFGIHSIFYLDKFENQSLEERQKLYDAFGGSTATMDIQQRNAQMMLAVVPLIGVTAASAAATAMSSRNRVNFLNYHAGQYTDAFMDMMAGSPEVLRKGKAYEELVYGGLLGAGGHTQVQMGWEFNPMNHFLPGLTIERDGKTVNPYVDMLKMQQAASDMFEKNEYTVENIQQLHKMNEDFATLQASIREKLSPGGVNVPFSSKGGLESSNVQAHLLIQESAGVGARTLIIPKLGRMDGRHFVFDENSTSHVQMTSVRLLPPAALKAMGSYDDYSDELQRLQVRVEQLTSTLSFFHGPNTINRMTAVEKDNYKELMYLIGALDDVQRQAAATGLQKALGGQLALGGRNMVVGTLPEVPRGVMVLGSKAWEIMREGIGSEIIDSFKGSATHAEQLGNLLRGFRKTLDGSEHGEINNLINRTTALADVGMLDSTQAILNDALEYAPFRNTFARGAFQRAGAPFGPEGLVIAKIMTGAEYNAKGPGLAIRLGMSETSVFMHSGAMAFNLGDYDGDTGSVTFLHRYASIKAQKLAGGVLSANDSGLLRRVEANLNRSDKSINIQFARHYSGLGEIYSEKALYFGDDHELNRKFKGNTEKAMVHLQFLAKNRDRLGSVALEHLNRFEERESALDKLATAGNAYVSAQHEAHNQVYSYIQAHTNGVLSREQLFVNFFETKAGLNALEGLTKVSKYITDLQHGVTGDELKTIFIMTSYAATTIISKSFEMAYGMQSQASRDLAHNEYKLLERARSLVGADINSWSQAQNKMASFGKIDALQERLLADHKVMLEDHAMQAGRFLILQQIAREAIKPKNGDLIKVIRESEGYTSGVDIANKMVRTVGLDALHRIATGSALGYEPKSSLFRDTQDAKTSLDKIDNWDQLHNQIKAMLVDYHKGQAMDLWSNGMLDKEGAAKYFKGDMPEGFQTFESAKAADEYAKGLNSIGLKTDDTMEGRAIKAARLAMADDKSGDQYALGNHYQQALVEDYISQKQDKVAYGMISDAMRSRGVTEKKSTYMQALGSKDEHEFQTRIQHIGVEDKLNIIGQASARGSFSNPEVMERALLDVFHHFSMDTEDLETSTRALHNMALRETRNEKFADHMSSIFNAFASSDMQEAIRIGGNRSRQAFNAKEAGYRTVLRNELDSHLTEAERADLADKDSFGLIKFMTAQEKAGDSRFAGKIDLGIADEKRKAAYLEARQQVETAHHLDESVRTLALTQGQRETAESAGPVTAEDKQRHIDNFLVKGAKSEHAMNGLGGGIIPAILLVGAGGMGGWLAMSAPADAADNNKPDFGQALGESAAMTLAFSNPNMLLRQVTAGQHSLTDKAVTAGVMVASLGAGAYTAHLANEWASHHAIKVLSPGEGMVEGEKAGAKAGLFGLAVSSVAGLVVGSAVNVLGTALMQHFGLMQGINPIPEAIAQMTVLGSLLSGGGDSEFNQAVDDEMGMGDNGDNQEGVITLVDANGEIVDQEFYVSNPNAVDENGDYDTSQMMEEDLDAFVSAADVDANSAGVNDTLVG